MSKTNKKRGKRIMWIIISSIIGVIVLVILGGIIFTAPGRTELKNMVIENVDFKNLHDGTYVGKYKGTKDSFRNAAVEVTIKSGVITNIKVIEGALKGDKQTAEVRRGKSINDLFNNVIDSKSLKVDAISGATLTSNAHLKALEDALEQAENK